jgi:ADP-glucose pyrophosphorylase
VLVLSADHVYRLGYGEVLARHRDRRAGVTVVTSEVPADEASRQAVVEVGGDGPALVGEQAQVPEAATVKPGGRFGGSG